MNKRGQGLPLNTIIIAIIVLVVLVVLVAIFTGRIALFDRGVGEASQLDLVRKQTTYGDCRPSSVEESTFTSCLKDDSQDDALCSNNFDRIITECKALASDQCTNRCFYSG